MVKMKSPNTLIDALYNVNASAGGSDDYSRGIVIGVMAALIAERDCSFDTAVEIVVEHLPLCFDPNRIPEAWRDNFVDERDRKVQVLREIRELSARYDD